MRFGIIGFGRIARKFCTSITFSDGNEVIAIASKSVSSEDEYIKQHPTVTIYHDYDALLKDENVDAVYVALPHKYHYEWIIKALENKKAVLSEKPAVLKSSEMKHIKEVAVKNNTFFLEALKTKMNESFLRLIEDLPLIGELKTIEANFCFDASPLKGKSYLFEPDQGGALNDVGSYLLGYVMKLVNQPVKDVHVKAKIVDEIDEHFNADIIFENDVVASIEGAIDENKIRYALITGTKGSIMVPMFNRMIDYTITLNDGTEIKRHYPIVGDDMTYQINVCSESTKNGKVESELHTLDEMIAIVEVTEKIRNAF